MTSIVFKYRPRFSFRFFRKSKAPKKPAAARQLKPFEIYRYADKFDIFLMIIGSIAGELLIRERQK